jgi:hypothetical protein
VVLTFILGVKKLLLNKIIKRRNAMSFLRHVGKHGDRKVAVIFREVPGEPHMCLVTYTELLNQHIHNPMIKCIESDIGQNSENLADALNRTYTTDGNPILQVLHREGQLKKVNTELVIMTPAPNTKIKLNELNKILNEMKQGEAAVKRLAEIDNSRGLQDPADVARRMRGNQAPSQNVQSAQGALADNELANNLRQQAQKMDAEAKGLLAESQRLLKEAAQMDGGVLETMSTASISAQPKRRGRPAKAKVVV